MSGSRDDFRISLVHPSWLAPGHDKKPLPHQVDFNPDASPRLLRVHRVLAPVDLNPRRPLPAVRHVVLEGAEHGDDRPVAPTKRDLNFCALPRARASSAQTRTAQHRSAPPTPADRVNAK